MKDKVVLPSALAELHEARLSLQCAKDAMDYADPEYLDIAIEQYRLAELTLNLALKKAKIEGVVEPLPMEGYDRYGDRIM